MNRHYDKLISAWQSYLQAHDWKILAQNLAPRKNDCGTVYELGNPLHRPDEDIAIVEIARITQPHHHPQTEIYFVLQGSGLAIVGGQKKILEKNIALVIPANVAHFVVPYKDLVVAVVSTPPFVLGASVVLTQDDPASGFSQEQFDQYQQKFL